MRYGVCAPGTEAVGEVRRSCAGYSIWAYNNRGCVQGTASMYHIPLIRYDRSNLPAMLMRMLKLRYASGISEGL